MPWEIAIPNHEPRNDSPEYVESRKAFQAIVKQPDAGPFLYPLVSVQDAYQDHHGGGMWVHDADGWLFVKNLAGMEWSAQFCADPKKVDRLRQFARRVYRAFPGSLEKIAALNPKLGGAAALQKILDTPVTDANGIAQWVDSIFNASVPLDAAHHTGFITSTKSVDTKGGPVGGVHHYPTPITDIQFIKYDDFRMWVTDDQGNVAAVTPAGKRGSGDARVRVNFATPGTPLHSAMLAANQQGDNLIVPAGDTMSKEAFQEQT